MSNFEGAEILRNHRPLLLAAEAIGWFHMAGKAHPDFLREHGGLRKDYDYQQWHQRENPPFPWGDLFQGVSQSFSSAWWRASTDFIEKHADKGGLGLLGLLQAGHAMASGIEKQSVPPRTVKYLGQDATHMWLSSAFGQPACNLLVNPPHTLSEQGWRDFLAAIKRILSELSDLESKKVTNIQPFEVWRQAAIEIGSVVHATLTSTLAETRLPNNDVTLWDQSFVAASLFKSATAGAMLEGTSFPWQDDKIKQTTRWRLLTVGIGLDHYESRAVRIGDWTGAQLAIKSFFEKVCRLVEVDLAVGTVLYRDSDTSVFSFPGERLNQSGDLSTTWKEWLQNEIDAYAQEIGLETPPYCEISLPSRSLVPLTNEVRKARDVVAVPLHRAWSIPSLNSSGKGGHICPVCLVRTNSNSADKQKVCNTCHARRTHRLDAWLQGHLGTDTIWLDEVADGNDRLAMITMSLDIGPWLEGCRLEALRTQAISEWRRCNPVLGPSNNPSSNPVDPDNPFEDLVRYVKQKLGTFDRTDPVLGSLQEGYPHESTWESFYQKIVEDRADAPSWNQVKDDHELCARWLVQQLFCKLPSPGRVHRFWRQTEEFFSERLTDFREVASADPNRWRTCRLVLKPDASTKHNGWQDREVYDGKWRDEPLVVLFRTGTSDFLSACNLARLLTAEEKPATLNGEKIALRSGDGQDLGLRVDDIRENAGSLSIYNPVIPLELSPLRFRLLVPLEAASKCVDRTIEAWNDQFAHVWDRLPLRVGLVAFPRTMPFQAVIEAARTIEDELVTAGPELWRVETRNVQEEILALGFARPDGNGELRAIPTTLPDGRTDVFYPYVAVEGQNLRSPRDFQDPHWQLHRHARDLYPGDRVQVYPAKVATAFLDSTGMRFEETTARPLNDWIRMREVWRLVEDTAPSLTAVRSAWRELCARRQAWCDSDGECSASAAKAWRDLVRAVLSKRWEATGIALDTLVEAAQSGILAWSLEWHLSVLKKRFAEAANV